MEGAVGAAYLFRGVNEVTAWRIEVEVSDYSLSSASLVDFNVSYCMLYIFRTWICQGRVLGFDTFLEYLTYLVFMGRTQRRRSLPRPPSPGSLLYCTVQVS